MLPVVVAESDGSACNAAWYIAVNVLGSIWNGPVAEPPDAFGIFVHWLSIVHMAASAVAFTPSDDASLTAVLPHDWLSSVLSTGPPTPVPPGAVVPSPDPSDVAVYPAFPPDGLIPLANGFAVLGEIVIKGTPGSGA